VGVNPSFPSGCGGTNVPRCGQEGVNPPLGYQCLPVGLNWALSKWVTHTHNPPRATVTGSGGPARKGLSPVPSRGDSVPRESWGGEGHPASPSDDPSGAGGVAKGHPRQGQLLPRPRNGAPRNGALPLGLWGGGLNPIPVSWGGEVCSEGA